MLFLRYLFITGHYHLLPLCDVAGFGWQVEEQKRRAEADKLAAITALEVRSREFMVEKEEKRRLEARITSMQSQLLIGGHKIEDMPVFRSGPVIFSKQQQY